ncbi:hypothetical protein KSC_049390 [Ktedonobacter sp. SOSP1-52]|nr:hypothetical protein KSC_049390 [Ktedonobacter sp. SOSP1-52]
MVLRKLKVEEQDISIFGDVTHKFDDFDECIRCFCAIMGQDCSLSRLFFSTFGTMLVLFARKDARHDDWQKILYYLF